ncbi:MAG: sugar-transfer associated ATP-grasp domain-containing protein [Planctomycetales bacterium]
MASHQRFQHRPWWQRYTIKAALTATWPLRVLYEIAHFTRKFGREVKATTGKRCWRQAIEQAALSCTRFLPSRAYYQYGLYLDARRHLAVDFIHNQERASLCTRFDGNVSSDRIQDKVRFTRECDAAGLPAAPVLAIVCQSQTGCSDWQKNVITPADPASLPECDLFIKPVAGCRGQGVMRWQHLHEDWYRNSSGSIHSAAELLARLREIANGKSFLVQPCLENHRDIANLSNGALATVRIVTGREPCGHVVPIAATFKMPFGQSITDNLGLSSPVDLETGMLGTACRYRAVDQVRDRHPETHAIISGRMLPGWKQARALVERAHGVFDEHAFLGWDVALTPDGPILLEGNIGWDVSTVQKPQGVPLGHTPFAAVCEKWLDRCA